MLDWANERILVTGGAGFLGSRVVALLRKRGADDIRVPRSIECDLRNRDNCARAVHSMDIVFHLAAKVGGIGFNLEKPGELFFDNLMMGCQLIDEARRANVQKLVTVATICSYPKYARVPFSESSLWDGYPEETNAPYGLAKKMLLVQSAGYRQQYGFNSVVLFPTNLYGPGDNFDLRSSHVIPALIRKVREARVEGSDHIAVWSDGTPTRDFLYVEDAALGIVKAAEEYDKSEPINLGSGTEISIRDLFALVCDLMDFRGKPTWDTSKPGGQPRRRVSIERAQQELGWTPTVTLADGLQRTIKWYEDSLTRTVQAHVG